MEYNVYRTAYGAELPLEDGHHLEATHSKLDQYGDVRAQLVVKKDGVVRSRISKVNLTDDEGRRKAGDELAALGLHVDYKSVLRVLDEALRRRPPVTQDEAACEFTDVGNRDRFVAEHGETVRYCHPFKSFLIYDGKRWAFDIAGEVVEKAISTIRNTMTMATAILDSMEADDKQKAQALAQAKHAIQSQKAPRIRDMLFLAQSALPISPAELDVDPYLLNCQNGTLDLRTGRLRQHSRGDLITKVTPVEYIPDARAPRWEEFLHQVFEGDEEMVSFMRRAAGYSLLGTQPEHVMFVLYGIGRNGKGIFVETLRSVLGDDYGRTAPVSMLLAKDQEGIPNDLAGLRGARLVTAAEPNEGRRLDEGRVKALTGGDTLTARFLHGEFFDFSPAFTLWLSTNHKPVIRGTDDGIWSRLRLVPFNVRFYLPDEPQPIDIPPERKADTKLRDKLVDEYQGILTWMVQGFLEWKRVGSLQSPERVREATKSYRAGEDVLGGFLDECCVFEENAAASAKELYGAYSQWAGESGERPLSQIAVGKKLQERGLDAVTMGTGGKRYRAWVGIRVRSQFRDQEVA